MGTHNGCPVRRFKNGTEIRPHFWNHVSAQSPAQHLNFFEVAAPLFSPEGLPASQPDPTVNENSISTHDNVIRITATEPEDMIMGARLVASFLGPEYGPSSGPSFFHGPERVSEAGERTEVTPKLKPYPMPATVSPRDIACSHTSFVLRHTSTLNPNPKLQRHLDPAGFLCSVLLARSWK